MPKKVCRAPHLAFIVPLRHHENSRDWRLECETLSTTARSIAAQDGTDWTAIVVCNRESNLPQLPDGIRIERVDFPPNPYHDLSKHALTTAKRAVRIDKGRRILAGMRAVPHSTYYMFVDADDLVSRRLSRFVANNSGGPGWFVADGYALNHHGSWTYRIEGNFHKTAGTSHIVRANLYNVPENDEPAFAPYVSVRLGSHGAITELFADDGHPLTPLPFPGAAYVVGHSNSHSISNTLIRQYILNKHSFRNPLTLPRKIAAMRLVTSKFRREFFGV